MFIVSNLSTLFSSPYPNIFHPYANYITCSPDGMSGISKNETIGPPQAILLFPMLEKKRTSCSDSSASSNRVNRRQDVTGADRAEAEDPRAISFLVVVLLQ